VRSTLNPPPSFADLTSVLATITRELRADVCVSHALAVREAWTTGNYRRFFKLHANAPRLAGYLMDKFAARERLHAINTIVKAYVPPSLLSPSFLCVRVKALVVVLLSGVVVARMMA